MTLCDPEIRSNTFHVKIPGHHMTGPQERLVTPGLPCGRSVPCLRGPHIMDSHTLQFCRSSLPFLGLGTCLSFFPTQSSILSSPAYLLSIFHFATISRTSPHLASLNQPGSSQDPEAIMGYSKQMGFHIGDLLHRC